MVEIQKRSKGVPIFQKPKIIYPGNQNFQKNNPEIKGDSNKKQDIN